MTVFPCCHIFPQINPRAVSTATLALATSSRNRQYYSSFTKRRRQAEELHDVSRSQGQENGKAGKQNLGFTPTAGGAPPPHLCRRLPFSDGGSSAPQCSLPHPTGSPGTPSGTRLWSHPPAAAHGCSFPFLGNPGARLMALPHSPHFSHDFAIILGDSVLARMMLDSVSISLCLCFPPPKSPCLLSTGNPPAAPPSIFSSPGPGSPFVIQACVPSLLTAPLFLMKALQAHVLVAGPQQTPRMQSVFSLSSSYSMS